MAKRYDPNTVLDEPPQPKEPVHTLNKTRIVDGVRWVAGVGKKDTDLVFVGTSLTEEEDEEEVQESYRSVRIPARYLKHSGGETFKRVALLYGIDIEECYYTTICKWLLPHARRISPSTIDIELGIPCLTKELQEIKPKIVVAMGKCVLDFLIEEKVPKTDVEGVWFFSKKFNCKVYYMEPPIFLDMKPETVERFKTDFESVAKELEQTRSGIMAPSVELNYKVINNSQELSELVDYLESNRKTVISIDCEWHGNSHVDGKLRSLQLGYGNGEASYIRFRDDQTNYVFDVEYREAGKILARWLDRPEVKYIGHHISADLPWMHHWLGLEWYRKTLLDTEFGLQCCDENEELGLERLAIKYTDMGRYDWELYMWKRNKENKPLCEDGYGYIPDDILIPYALADVDCVYRSAPIIMADMRRQGVWEYYQQTFGPFTSDVFTWFVLVGLPMDIPLMDDLRDLFQYVTVEFEKEFQNDVFGTIQKKFINKCKELSESQDIDVTSFEDAMDAWEEGVFKTEKVKALSGQFATKTVGPQNVKIIKPIIDSLFTINKSFNLYSTDHKKMLLFDVLGLMPVKSTANKSAGMPSVDWETVMEYPPERRKLFTPATDKQTIEILGSQCGEELLQEWLNLNAVGNLRKAFLKEATLDEETGEVTKENGLHKWLCSDDRIHGMFSTTETGRPRSWKPNVLNWPKYASKRVMAGVETLLKQRNEQGVLPDHLKKWLNKKIPGVRSCVRIQEGWCIVESDYQTAEVRGLGYISGDANLISLVDEPDPCYVKLNKTGQEATGVNAVRVAYPEYLTCSDPAYLRKVHKTQDGETTVIDVLDEWVVKDDQGNEVHAKADLHWSLAEMALKLPREVLDEVYRAMGKVGNFCVISSTLVKTQKGDIPITKLSIDDLVWDGNNWVSHEGIICHGRKKVITYGKLTATPDHLVWTDSGLITMLDAKLRQVAFTESSREGQVIEVGDVQCEPDRYTSDRRQEIAALCRGDLPSLWSCVLEELGQSDSRALTELLLYSKEKIQGYSSKDCSTSWSEIQLHDAKVLERFAQAIERLQRTGHPSAFCIAGRVRKLGLSCLSGSRLQETGVRQDRQQWTLLKNESSSCKQSDQSSEHTNEEISSGVCRHIYGDISGMYLQSSNNSEPASEGYEHGSYLGEVAKLASNLQEEAKILGSCMEADVYDIINAGEHHRFTANGYLISNSSAYGASGATLERKIESDTKKKPDPGMGDALLRALDERQPVASDYLRDCERIPAEVGTMRAFSGRVRHFHTNKQYRSDSRVSKLLRKKLAAMGRECRNFPMQESVAFSSARACVWLLEFKRKFNLQGYPFSVLYDAITSGCPLHERAIWTKAHTLFMFLKNGHRYDTRLLRYPVDHELNIAWSWAPDDETLKLWKNPEFEPTPPELKHVENWLDREIAFYTENPWSSTSKQTLRDLDWHASIPDPTLTTHDHNDAA